MPCPYSMTINSDKSPQPLKPYEYATSVPMSYQAKETIAKLNLNEASYPPSPKVQGAIQEFIRDHPLNWYPDTEARELKAALSSYVGQSTDCLIVFNGCDAALEVLCHAYLKADDEVLIFAPNYDNFRVFAEIAKAKTIPLVGPSAFEHDLSLLSKKITERTKLIYLSNPTNPTGKTYSIAEVEIILQMAGQARVIVDEAYFEFWGETCVELIHRYENLLVTRSFSKAFSLAGLRCGYLVTQPKNIHHVSHYHNAKSVNSLAQVAALASLEDRSYTFKNIKILHEIKNEFVRQLEQSNIPVRNTPANFVLIKVASPDSVQALLESQHIYIRNRSTVPQLKGMLRITIGDDAEMKRLLVSLRLLPEQMIWESEQERTTHFESAPNIRLARL